MLGATVEEAFERHPFDFAAFLAIEHRVGAIPVVDDGGSELVGIVSYVDALRAAREALSLE